MTSSYSTASLPIRWVNKWGGWIARPERSSIPESLIREVVDGARLIERRFGRPVDLEWAFDGHSLSWLQMREITSGTECQHLFRKDVQGDAARPDQASHLVGQHSFGQRCHG